MTNNDLERLKEEHLKWLRGFPGNNREPGWCHAQNCADSIEALLARLEAAERVALLAQTHLNLINQYKTELIEAVEAWRKEAGK